VKAPLTYGHAKSKIPAPRVCFLAFDYLNTVIARNGWCDLAAIIAGRIRVADAFTIRIGDENSDRMRAAELLGPNCLASADFDNEVSFIAIVPKSSGDVGARRAASESNTRGTLSCGAAR